ncbi:MAG: hypothetical protein HND48_21650 [Chloroflexi bacterium]|nr:hypothetical protein [Chloroflexota bacterium]
MFVCENGQVIEISDKGVRRAERVPGGYVFVDGSGVGDVGRAVIRDREILSRDGFLVVFVNVDRQNGTMVGDPDIVSRGFAYEANDPDLARQIKAVVADTLAAGRMNGRRQSLLEENLSRCSTARPAAAPW